MHKAALTLAIITTFSLAAHAELTCRQTGAQILVDGGNFKLIFDTALGGTISELQLHDGGQWHTVFGGPSRTFPTISLVQGETNQAHILNGLAAQSEFETRPDRIILAFESALQCSESSASPWRATLRYEIYAEGAVFCDVCLHLREGAFNLAEAGLHFEVDEAIRNAPKFRDENVAIKGGGLRSARVAYGMNPAKTYTNEVEVFVEHRQGIGSDIVLEQKKGSFTWRLGSGNLEGPFTYRNNLALAFTSAVNGKPKSNVVAQRVYHWVNWLDLDDWYPTNEQIDKMAANNATMLILHHEYLLQRGSNGYPHAEYDVARNHGDMVRMMDYAHAKGLRVGLYMRGVEPYALAMGFWGKYCKRNWDGIYCDWHGPTAVAWHEEKYAPETKLGDVHFSEEGSWVPAKDYFLFTKRQRETVGPQGFLIGHQGSFNSGILANLCYDAYLPGETGADRHMFANIDEAGYKGMLGGCVCMPWTLDLPKYRNPEGAAKMAAWGFYPHIVMGIKARQGEELTFSLDPDAPEYAFVLPYWRLLAQIDAEKATVYNLASQNVDYMTSSNPAIQGVVYKESADTFLIIVANLGEAPASAQLVLNAEALGLSGDYALAHIAPETGAPAPQGTTKTTLTTSELPQWGIEAYKLTK